MATITLTATPDVTSSPPRVRLDVTATGTPAVTQVVIARRDADGQMRPVRTSDAGPLPLSAGAATIYDYEAPFGTQVVYSTDQAGGPSATTSLDVHDIWLVHIGVPSRSVRLDQITVIGDESRATSSGLFPVLDRGDPIPVSSGARATPTGMLGARTTTDAAQRAMNLLLDDDTPVLLNMPTSRRWGIDTCYLSLRDSNADRTVRYGPVPLREWRLPYQVIRRPGGGTQAAITWNDVAAQYPTWQAIVDAGVTSWAELAAPTT